MFEKVYLVLWNKLEIRYNENMDFNDYTGSELNQAEACLFDGRDMVPSFMEAYGFKHDTKAGLYVMRKPLNGIDGFEAQIEITEDGNVTGHVFDTSFGSDDEYLLLRVTSSQGEFAKEIRNAYVDVLRGIREKCSLEPGFMLDPIKDAKRYEVVDTEPVEKASKPQKRKANTKKKKTGDVDNVWLMFLKERNSFAFEIDHVTTSIPLGVECNIGDIVYVYIGAPTNAIMYKCTVESADIGVLDLSVAESYTSRSFPKAFLARYGVKNVRGMMPMPKLLYDNIAKS